MLSYRFFFPFRPHKEKKISTPEREEQITFPARNLLKWQHWVQLSQWKTWENTHQTPEVGVHRAGNTPNFLKIELWQDRRAKGYLLASPSSALE